MSAEPDLLLKSLGERVFEHLRPTLEAEVSRLVDERLEALGVPVQTSEKQEGEVG